MPHFIDFPPKLGSEKFLLQKLSIQAPNSLTRPDALPVAHPLKEVSLESEGLC